MNKKNSPTLSGTAESRQGVVTDAMRKAFDDRNNTLEANERDDIIAAILAIAAPMPQAEPEYKPRKLVRYGDCKCILTQYCDGTCNPIFEDSAPQEASKG